MMTPSEMKKLQEYWDEQEYCPVCQKKIPTFKNCGGDFADPKTRTWWNVYACHRCGYVTQISGESMGKLHWAINYNRLIAFLFPFIVFSAGGLLMMPVVSINGINVWSFVTEGIFVAIGSIMGAFVSSHKNLHIVDGELPYKKGYQYNEFVKMGEKK